MGLGEEVVDGRKIGCNRPPHMRRHHEKANGDADIRRRGSKIFAPIRVQQRDHEKRGEENERGVLGEQSDAAQEAGAHAEADAARLQRLEKEIGGPRPRADQRRIDVEFEGPEGKRRRQHLKQD